MSDLLKSYDEARSTDFYFAKKALQNFCDDVRKLSKKIHDGRELPEGYKFTTSPIEKNSFSHYMQIDGSPVKLFEATAEKDGTLLLKVLKDLTDKSADFETEIYAVDKLKGISTDLNAAMGSIIVGYVQQAEDLSLQEPVIEQSAVNKKQAGFSPR